jgi:hypothetical protein
VRGTRGGRSRRVLRSARHFALALLFLLLSACAGREYVPADPVDPNRIVCCTGVVTRLDHRADGTFEIDLDPEEDRNRWLRTGQEVLRCVQPDPARDQFARAVGALRVGSRARICGYWVRALRDDRHLIVPITALLPLSPES